MDNKTAPKPSEFSIVSHMGRAAVVEKATGLIWRSLDTRDEAQDWARKAEKVDGYRR